MVILENKYPELYEGDTISFFEDSAFYGIDNMQELDEFKRQLERIKSIIEALTPENIVAFNLIAQDLNRKKKEMDVRSWWDLNPETMDSGELLFLICYPFFLRGSGPWEVRFASSGDLAKYLKLYKEKIEAMS